jgi:hypothetical protein
MVIGWFSTLVQADSYFTDERLETSAWDALSDANQTKALMQAYNRIYYSGLFAVPLLADATAAELVLLKKAQAEMAYYLAQHLADEDRRKGIQSQGVIEAGIVKEKYQPGSLSDIPIPPIVAGILEDFSTAASPIYVTEVDRDEDEEGMEL